jgi:hypothetical protein
LAPAAGRTAAPTDHPSANLRRPISTGRYC